MPIRGIFRASTGAGSFAATPDPVQPPNIVSFTLDDHSLDVGQVGTFTFSFGGGTLTGWTLNIDDAGGAEYSGSAGGTQQHTYSSPGTYTARLIANGPGGSPQATITDIVVVHAAPNITSFTISDSTPTNGVPVTFSATISGVVTSWSLSSGQPGQGAYTGTTSTISQPHTYTSDGTWTATLNVSGPNGSDVETISSIVVLPDVRVLGNGNVITDGDATPSLTDHTQFVNAVQSAGGTSRTFTVENPGSSVLTTSNLSVPAGFTVTEGLAASIAAGGSDTFTVRLDDATLGTKSGDISFANNVSGKSPYNFAVAGDVVAATGDFPTADDTIEYMTGTWADFTETRINFGPATTNVQARFRFRLDPGMLKPSTHQLYAEVDGAEVPLQISERSFYRHPGESHDGDLQWFTAHVLYTGTWAVGTKKTWTIKKRSGALHAESDSRTVALVNATAGRNIHFLFTDVQRVGTLATYGTGEFYAKLNDALALGHVRKTAAGPLYSEWEIEDFVRAGAFESGGARDAYWWVRWIIGVYCDNGTNTVRATIVDPMISTGSATIAAPALALKAVLKDGAAVLRDCTGSFTFPASAINATPGQYTIGDPIAPGDPKVPMGGGKLVSGDIPSGTLMNRLYRVLTNETANHGVGYKGNYLTEIPTGGVRLPIGANGGGNFTLETRIWLYQRRPILIRDLDGWEIRLGGSKVGPAWTRAEKIDRMNRAIVRPCDLGGTSSFFEDSWKHYPGSTNFLRSGAQDPGDYYDLGEIGGAWFRLFLDMDSELNHNQFRKIAAESAGYEQSQYVDSSTNGATGTWFFNHLVVTGGPSPFDGSVAYANMGFGSKFGFINGSNGGGGPDIVGGQDFPGDGAAVNPPWNGTWDGSHPSASRQWDWVAYGLNSLLHVNFGDYIARSMVLQQVAGSPQDTIAGDRFFNGRRYYRCALPGFCYSPPNGPRGFTGTMAGMKLLYQVGSLRREYTYARDWIDDQRTWFQECMTNSQLMQTKAKKLGVLAAINGGGNTIFGLARCIQLHIDIVRQGAKHTKNQIKVMAAHYRGSFGDAIGGVQRREYIPGMMVALNDGSIIYYPNARGVASNVPPQDWHLGPWQRSDIPYFDSTVPWRTTLVENGQPITFKSDGQRVTVVPSASFPAIINGDFFHIEHYKVEEQGAVIPPLISTGVLYYPYSASGNDWLISSTDPSAGAPTPVTWTPGTTYALSGARVNWSFGGPGSRSNGLAGDVAEDYFSTVSGAGPLLLHYYGDTLSQAQTAYNNAVAVQQKWKDQGFGMENGGAAKGYQKYQPT